MKDERPRRVREQISVQQVGAETLVYDQRRHRAFCLNATAGTVWRLSDGARTIAAIAMDATRELGAEASEELALLALEELRQDGLIEAREEMAAGAGWGI